MQIAKSKVLGLALAVAMVATALVAAPVAMAQEAQDYSDLTDGFAAELGAALPIGLAAVGLFIGVIMAYKVVRRILRA
jgi:Sec-independent protein secretion pathway component TatC